jgi:hypothetical protein
VYRLNPKRRSKRGNYVPAWGVKKTGRKGKDAANFFRPKIQNRHRSKIKRASKKPGSESKAYSPANQIARAYRRRQNAKKPAKTALLAYSLLAYGFLAYSL